MVSLNLRGRTNAQMAPQTDEYTEIFLPNISKFGFEFDFEVVRKGFFPMGGGEVNFFLKPVKQLKSITITDLGLGLWSPSLAGVSQLATSHRG